MVEKANLLKLSQENDVMKESDYLKVNQTQKLIRIDSNVKELAQKHYII